MLLLEHLVFNSTAGWETTEYVGVSLDLGTSLQNHMDDHGPETVAHVRAMSFVFPSQGAMENIAEEWRTEVRTAGGKLGFTNDEVLAAMEQAIPYDDDDDDDDDDDEDLFLMADVMSAARGSSSQSTSPELSESSNIVSPFEGSNQLMADGVETLPFTKENVDKVLEEVRPYLISDGGNVSVQRVDEEAKEIYLKLEGACGSCPSSTVTMQMGIERVLKENFADLREVKLVEEEGAAKPTELTYEAVEAEINRIKPAIIAMGGVVKIVEVNPIGEVKLEFRGANKLRQGLELALLDVNFVKHVTFVMGDE